MPGHTHHRELVGVVLACASLSLAACANSGSHTAAAGKLAAPATPHTATPATGSALREGYLHLDGDSDADDQGSHIKGPSSDDRIIIGRYPHEADAVDKRTIIATVKRYYAAALAGEGYAICSIIDSTLASGLVATDRSPGTRAACAESARQLFEQEHPRLLADQIATMRVTDVRVRGNVGLALVGFETAPEADLILRRSGTRWKLDAFEGKVP